MKPQATVEGPEIQISCLSNVYVRRMAFEKANIVEVGHRHPYDHASLVASGSIEVQLYDDESQSLLDPVRYEAPAMVMIKKNTAHQITSLEDNTVVCCIHALRDEDSEIIDPSMIPVPTPLRTVILGYMQTTGKQLQPPFNPFDDLTSNRIPRMFNSSSCF